MTAQTSIPGTERTKHKDITKAALAYREIRDERMALTKKEVEAKQRLAEVMKKHKLELYVDEDEELKVFFASKTKESVKVRDLETDEADEDSED